MITVPAPRGGGVVRGPPTGRRAAVPSSFLAELNPVTSSRSQGIGIVADAGAEAAARARRLAAALRLPILEGSAALHLLVAADRLALRTPMGARCRELVVDFDSDEARRRATGLHGADPLLAHALGLDRGVRSILDATAGLGRDASALARRGACVVMVERNPILAELLADGLARAARAGDPIAERLSLVHTDALEHLASLSSDARPDAIYLDPMFPPTRKAALPQFELQVLRELLGDDAEAGSDAVALLAAARRVTRRRVVVKRPPRAAPIAAGRIAAHAGTRVRYDVYAPSTSHGATPSAT